MNCLNTMAMKAFIALIGAALLLAGCAQGEVPVTPLTPVGVYHAGVYLLEYNGHEYLWNSNGGIIHSESCPCWTRYEETEIEYD